MWRSSWLTFSTKTTVFCGPNSGPRSRRQDFCPHQPRRCLSGAPILFGACCERLVLLKFPSQESDVEVNCVVRRRPPGRRNFALWKRRVFMLLFFIKESCARQASGKPCKTRTALLDVESKVVCDKFLTLGRYTIACKETLTEEMLCTGQNDRPSSCTSEVLRNSVRTQASKSMLHVCADVRVL